jgi:hypothetical protein
MSRTPTRLEKPLLLTSASGLCLSIYSAAAGNLLDAAATICVTFLLLGQMLDYAIAAQSGQAHWLSTWRRSLQSTFTPAATIAHRG